MFINDIKSLRFTEQGADILRKNLYVYISIFLAVYVVSTQQIIRGLAMDDLGCWVVYHDNGNMWDFIWNTVASKFRPVANFFMGIGFWLVGSNTEYLWLWMLLINYSTAIMVFHVFKRISSDRYVAFLGTLVYVVCRFAYYTVSRYFGIMETVAMALAIKVLDECLMILDSDRPIKHTILASIYSFLVIFCHERYLCLPPLIMLATLLMKDGRTWKRGAVTTGVLACLVAAIMLRKVFLGATAWTGSASDSNVIEAFDFSRVISFLIQAILYVVGINTGPDYLCGYTFERVPLFIYGMLAIVWIVVFWYMWWAVSSKQLKENWKRYFIVVAFIGATLVVSCTTERLELRWIYTPFVGLIVFCLLLTTERKAKNLAGRRLLPTFAAVFVILIEIFFHTGYGSIFSWDPQNAYNQIYNETVDQYGSMLEGKEIVIITNSLDNTDNDTVQTFFREYARADGYNAPQVTVYQSIYDFEYTGDEDIILSIDRTAGIYKWGSIVKDITADLKLTYELMAPTGTNIREAKRLTGFYAWEGSDKEYIWTSQISSMQISTGEKGVAKLIASTPAFNLPNSITVYFENEIVYSGEILEENIELTFVLPANAEGQLRIELTNANTPYEVGVGEDRRQLGICIRELTID